MSGGLRGSIDHHLWRYLYGMFMYNRSNISKDSNLDIVSRNGPLISANLFGVVVIDPTINGLDPWA